MLVRRFDGKKEVVSLEGIEQVIQDQFVQIAEEMYQSALKKMQAKQKKADNWEDFMKHLNDGNIVLTPWCDDNDWEMTVRARSGNESKLTASEGNSKMTGKAKTLCKPLNQEPLPEGTKCFVSGLPAKCLVWWGRSY